MAHLLYEIALLHHFIEALLHEIAYQDSMIAGLKHLLAVVRW
jgi:hypothetical protein